MCDWKTEDERTSVCVYACVIVSFGLRANKLIVNPKHDEGLQFGLGVLSNTTTDTCPVSVPAFAPHSPPPLLRLPALC